jgi:hypothetical protein
MSGPQSLGPGPRAADCQRSYLLRTPSQNRIGCAGAHVRPAVFGAGSMSRRLSALVHFAGALTDYDWMRWGSCQAQSLWGPFRGPQTWAADCQRWYIHFGDALTDYDWMRWGPCQAHILRDRFRGLQTVSVGTLCGRPHRFDWMRWGPCQARNLWALFRGPQFVSAGTLCGRPHRS